MAGLIKNNAVQRAEEDHRNDANDDDSRMERINRAYEIIDMEPLKGTKVIRDMTDEELAAFLEDTKPMKRMYKNCRLSVRLTYHEYAMIQKLAREQTDGSTAKLVESRLLK